MQGTNEDGSSTLVDSDIGPNPRMWNGQELKTGDKQFFYFRPGDQPPHFDPEATDYVGSHKGMRQVLYERGKFVEGMTANGERDAHIPENPDAWQPCDLVIRDEDIGGDETQRYLYRVLTVPGDHTDVSSDDDIQCEHLTLRQWKGIHVYVPRGNTWVFPANTLTSVDRRAYTIEYGKLRNKKKLGISFDLNSYWERLQTVSVCMYSVLNLIPLPLSFRCRAQMQMTRDLKQKAAVSIT